MEQSLEEVEKSPRIVLHLATQGEQPLLLAGMTNNLTSSAISKSDLERKPSGNWT